MTDVKTQVNTREFHTTKEMRTESGTSEAQWGHPWNTPDQGCQH